MTPEKIQGAVSDKIKTIFIKEKIIIENILPTLQKNLSYQDLINDNTVNGKTNDFAVNYTP